VDYSPVVFSFSHWEGFPRKNCVSCACGVWIYIFRIYIALFYSFLHIHTKREFCVLLFLPTEIWLNLSPQAQKLSHQLKFVSLSGSQVIRLIFLFK
jgi:hypothetical protein